MTNNMPQAPSSRRARATKKPIITSAAHFPVPIAIALTGVGIVFAIFLSGYVFHLFTGTTYAYGLSRPLTLMEKVERHILINTDEEPTIATVQNPEALRQLDSTFYKDVEVGDRLLVWSDKAILYSEAKDLVLSVLPVRFSPPNTLPTTSSGGSTTENVKESAKIEIRNGTRHSGLARDLATKLAKLSPSFNILAPRDAVRKNYTNTIVIKVTDKPMPETEKMLLEAMGGTIQPLPSWETNVKGDYLVIIGEDYQK